MIRSYANKSKRIKVADNADADVSTVQSTVEVQSVKSEYANYDCTYCDEGFASETEVEIHVQADHNLSLKKLERQTVMCKICAECFCSAEERVAHIKEVHLLSFPDSKRVERPIYVCDYCHNIFFSKAYLSFHFQMRHALVQPKDHIECTSCGVKILQASMWSHMEASHKIRSAGQCPICMEKQKDRAALTKHIATHPMLHECPLCPYQTKQANLYFAHMEKAHKSWAGSHKFPEIYAMQYFTYEKPYPRPWSYRAQLTTSGINLYDMVMVCVLCRHICGTVDEVPAHITEAHCHSEEREPTPAAKLCICGATFSTDIMLKLHMLKTEGEHAPLKTRYLIVIDDDELKKTETGEENSDECTVMQIVSDSDSSGENDVDGK